MTGNIFLIARLLADQHDLRSRRAFAKYSLRRVFSTARNPGNAKPVRERIAVSCHRRRIW